MGHAQGVCEATSIKYDSVLDRHQCFLSKPKRTASYHIVTMFFHCFCVVRSFILGGISSVSVTIFEFSSPFMRTCRLQGDSRRLSAKSNAETM